MSDYVTHGELDAAIASVKDDIAETERRLRGEFTDVVRYEVGKVDDHLEDQDGRLVNILRTAVAALISLLIWLAYYALTHR